MKRILTILLLVGICLPTLFEGCKKPGQDPDDPTTGIDPNYKQPERYFIATLNTTKNDLGLLVNDPLAKEQMVVFGPKDSSGTLKEISHLLQVKPGTSLWVLHTLGSDHYPSKSLFSSGQELQYSDYDRAKKTVAVKAVDSKKVVLWEKKDVVLDANFFETMDAYLLRVQSLQNGRLSAIERNTPTAVEAVYIAANAFGCLLGGVGLATGGPVVWLSAYSTFQSCKSAIQGAANVNQGKPAFDCMDEGDVANSGASYVGSVADFASSGNLPSFVASVVPQLIGDAAQSDGCDDSNSPPSSGGIFGDPHLSGLDGAQKLLSVAGEFWAIHSKNDEFAVQARFEPAGDKSQLSTATSLAIRTGQDVVSFTVKPFEMHINGKKIETNFDNYLLQDRAFIVRTGNNRYSVNSTFGDVLDVQVLATFNLSFYVRSLPDKRKNQVEGMCGQYNGDPRDDFQDKAGKIYNNGTPIEEWQGKFTDDWRIKQSESILFYPSGKNTETYTLRNFPTQRYSLLDYDLATRDRAEKTCRNAGVFGEPQLSDCMIDVMATGRNEMADQIGLAIQLKAQAAPSFRRQAAFPGLPRTGAIALPVGNRIFAGLGSGQNDWYEYDSAADNWAKRADFPGSSKGIYGMATFVIGQKVYLAGGVDPTDFKAVNWLWEYDTATNAWAKRKDVPGVARFNMAGFAANGRGFLVFGSNGGGGSASDYPEGSATYEYNPGSDSWTKKADFPGQPRGANFVDKYYNGTIMVIDGRPFVGGGPTSTRDWYEYKPATNIWEKRADLAGSGYFQFSVGGEGYMFSDGSSYLYIYDAGTDQWTRHEEFYYPGSRASSAIKLPAVINGRAYFGLGTSTGQENREWWSFAP